jgi:hypothetical protein
VRDRTHWKSQEIRPRDPVLLGLCQQIELDDAIVRAQAEADKAAQKAGVHEAAAPEQAPAAEPEASPEPMAKTEPTPEPATDSEALAEQREV